MVALQGVDHQIAATVQVEWPRVLLVAVSQARLPASIPHDLSVVPWRERWRKGERAGGMARDVHHLADGMFFVSEDECHRSDVS